MKKESVKYIKCILFKFRFREFFPEIYLIGQVTFANTKNAIKINLYTF